MDYYQCIYDAISIHALREEGDGIIFVCLGNQTAFLSTPSARRATQQLLWCSPRSDGISIHALREEGDDNCCSAAAVPAGFLSTPSARRATEFSLPVCVDVEISIHALREEGDGVARAVRAVIVDISIHALREEGDARSAARSPTLSHFYPRPPRGGRRETRTEKENQ